MNYVNLYGLNLSFGEMNKEGIEGIDYLRELGVYPLSVFSRGLEVEAVEEAMSFLSKRGYGSVLVPPTEEHQAFVLEAFEKKDGKSYVRFKMNKYRPPIGSEARPVLDTPWEVGDFVFSTEGLSNHELFGWVCVEGGIPGVWRSINSDSFSHIHITDNLFEAEEGDLWLKPTPEGKYDLLRVTEGKNSEQIVLSPESFDSGKWVKVSNLLDETKSFIRQVAIEERNKSFEKAHTRFRYDEGWKALYLEVNTKLVPDKVKGLRVLGGEITVGESGSQLERFVIGWLPALGAERYKVTIEDKLSGERLYSEVDGISLDIRPFIQVDIVYKVTVQGITYSNGDNVRREGEISDVMEIEP